MNKILFACISATLLGLSCTPSLRAQSGAESFNDIVSIFKSTSEPPELFLSPLTYASQGGTFSGVSFTVDGTALSMSAKFSPSPYVTSLSYQWLLPSASAASMTYDNDGKLTLAGTTNISLSPATGEIKIGTSPVLTAANAAGYLNSTYLPLVPGSAKVGTGNSITGSNALAVGSGVSVSGTNSVALGLGTTAVGSSQLVIGRYNAPAPTADGPLDVLFVVGGGTSAESRNALFLRADGTMRLNNRLIIGSEQPDPEWLMGANSLAAGRVTDALADSSVAFGVNAFATAPGAIAAGFQVRAGDWTTAPIEQANQVGVTCFGGWTWARYLGDLAFGAGSEAYGTWSTAGGYNTKASGPASVSIGNSSLAAGHSSVAFGMSNEAKGENSVALGTGLKAKGHSQTALGHYNLENGTEGGYAPTDNLLIVGNGTPVAPRTALTVQHNGNVNAAGVVRVWPAGDLGMGGFKAGTKPNVGVDPDAAP